MIKRRHALALIGAGLAGVPFGARSQPRKVPLIGLLALNASELLAPVRDGMRALGYVEGTDVLFLQRDAGDRYERLDEIANEYVKAKVDVIVTSGSTATTAARKATGAIPIVMVAGMDPVKAGIAASLARPAGNVTGLVTSIQELTAKRLELAKEIIPKLMSVGVLFNSDSRSSPGALHQAEDAAPKLGLTLTVADVKKLEEIGAAVRKFSSAGVQALLPISSSMFSVNYRHVLDAAEKFRMPGIYPALEWVEAGGLASYGSNRIRARRETARYVDRILKGARPGDLPIEQPVFHELVINQNTARRMKISVPQSVLLRADKVIS